MQPGFIAERSLGYVQTAAVDAATALTIPPGASMALITPQTQACRWRDDGIDPTAAVGYPLAAGTELRYTGRNLAALKFISQVAGCVLNVMFYGQGN